MGQRRKSTSLMSNWTPSKYCLNLNLSHTLPTCIFNLILFIIDRNDHLYVGDRFNMTDLINNTNIAPQLYHSDIMINFTSDNALTNRGFKLQFSTTGKASYIQYGIKEVQFL